jgi:hypothetical protein
MALTITPEVSLVLQDRAATLAHLVRLVEVEPGAPGPSDQPPLLRGVVRADLIRLDLTPADDGAPGVGYLSPVFHGRLSADGHRLEGRFRWGLGLKLLALLWIGWAVAIVPQVIGEAAAAGGALLPLAEAVVPPLMGLLAGLGLVWLARRHARFARGVLLATLEEAAGRRRGEG